MRHALSQINELSRADFVRLLGPVFEHSPWIAERAAARRPFAKLAALHEAMCATVHAATPGEQLALIRAHPDLVGRVVLTAESRGEQTSAGLTDLSPEEIAQFDRYNHAYKTRFDFPFVICARLNKKAAILAAFPIRLQNSTAHELTTALGEIFKIAEFRIHDLIHE